MDLEHQTIVPLLDLNSSESVYKFCHRNWQSNQLGTCIHTLQLLAFTVTFDLDLIPNVLSLFIGLGFSVTFKMVLHTIKNRSSVRNYIRYLFLIIRDS